ncbi:phosphoribosylanthranilate isomerase [Algoriphagus litoralis]|uniref:phosphoribosylanthranilate isomerase n=1 Tax=Algoriphagus litoralis TaxID=2202829 RepID=UPI000DB916E3|nr:phosphoribosylanthranilate isomerase [Algoriphagus litoralis]
MALRTFVKLNQISNLTDARYGAGMYVDLLGFNLNVDTENYITPAQFKELTGWVSGVEFVGEFSHESQPNILEIVKEYPGITWIEFDRIEVLEGLVGQGYALIYKMNLEDVKHIEPEVASELHKSGIIFHVVSKDNHLKVDDANVITKLAERCKVILGVGINSENVLKLVKGLKIFGISLDGGQESKPGLKDMTELSEILEKLEVEE